MKIKLRLGILEDEISQDLVASENLGRAYATPEILAYWQGAIDRLQDTDWLASPEIYKEAAAIEAPRPEHIDVLLCSPASLNFFSERGNAVGLHALRVLPGDPFGEDPEFSTAHRVLVGSDREDFIRLIAELAEGDDDPSQHLGEYLTSYLNTFFHEVAHALVFAENSALLTPAQIDDFSARGDFVNDVFDCLTSYGIRPVEIDGEEIWAEDADDAFDLIEDHIEQLGRKLLASALTGEQSIFNFPKAMAAEDEIERLTSCAEDSAA